MAYSLKCPACRVKFPWDPTKGFPEFCPNVSCETRIAHDRDDDDVVVPFVRSSATSANDVLYRQMESASEHRAEAAAHMAGTSVAEMSGLKITDLRSGDVAATPVQNDVTRQMDAIKQINPNASIGWGAGAEAGLHFSTAVSQPTGVGHRPDNNMGERTRSIVRSVHGEKNGYHGLSEIKTNETMKPGYRPRV